MRSRREFLRLESYGAIETHHCTEYLGILTDAVVDPLGATSLAWWLPLARLEYRKRVIRDVTYTHLLLNTAASGARYFRGRRCQLLQGHLLRLRCGNLLL